MNSSGISSFVHAVAGAVLALIVSAPPATAELVPHRAIYSLSLGDTDKPGQFLDVGGTVRTTLEKTCDAWITVEHVNMQVTTQTGGRFEQNLTYTGWESHDGKRYRFAARTISNGEDKKFRGAARLDAQNAGEAVYTKPNKLTMKLPPGTQFYWGLTAWLIKQAEAGASRAEAVVFDGTDEDGPQRAIAFIIPFSKKKAKHSLGPLLDRPGWTMRIAFYPIDGLSAVPDYEVQAVVLDNGVTPNMELVFTSFTAIQTLEKIEALDPPKC